MTLRGITSRWYDLARLAIPHFTPATTVFNTSVHGSALTGFAPTCFAGSCTAGTIYEIG